MWISTRSAVTAATALATDLGLRVEEPEVLAETANVIVHLRPTGLVARVATMTAVLRPGVERWLASDIALATYLDGRGVPVVRPSVDPPAGPHRVNGLVVALWRYVPHDPAALPSPAEFAASLASLHEALWDYPAPLAADGPLADLSRAMPVLEGWGLAPEAVARLRAAAERFGEVISGMAAQPLHGDAHPGNVLVTPDGLVWNDFEDAWLGPLAWDWACVARSARPGDWASVVDGRADPEELAACVELRRLYGVVWRQYLGMRFPARAEEARSALTDWLSAGSS
jgi:Phosphotransferase enzyme family